MQIAIEQQTENPIFFKQFFVFVRMVYAGRSQTTSGLRSVGLMPHAMRRYALKENVLLCSQYL